MVFIFRIKIQVQFTIEICHLRKRLDLPYSASTYIQSIAVVEPGLKLKSPFYNTGQYFYLPVQCLRHNNACNSINKYALKAQAVK